MEDRKDTLQYRFLLILSIIISINILHSHIGSCLSYKGEKFEGTKEYLIHVADIKNIYRVK